jgi:hypothetical protein
VDIPDEEQFLARHIRDSCFLAPWTHKPELLDLLSIPLETSVPAVLEHGAKTEEKLRVS